MRVDAFAPIVQRAAPTNGVLPIYIEPAAQKSFTALAKKVGASSLNFKGNPSAPGFPGY